MAWDFQGKEKSSGWENQEMLRGGDSIWTMDNNIFFFSLKTHLLSADCVADAELGTGHSEIKHDPCSYKEHSILRCLKQWLFQIFSSCSSFNGFSFLKEVKVLFFN